MDLLASGVSGITSISGGQGIATSVTNGVATIINTAQTKSVQRDPEGFVGYQFKETEALLG